MARGRQGEAALLPALNAAQQAAGLARSTTLTLLTNTTGGTLLRAAETEAVISLGLGLGQGMEAVGAGAAAADRLTGMAMG
jgi:hypothetical protein